MTQHKYPVMHRGWQDVGSLGNRKTIDTLPIEVSVIVPSTRMATPIPDAEFQKRVMETKRFLIRLFKGHTSVQGTGGYLHFPEERTVTVTSYAKRAQYLRAKRRLIAWVRSKEKAWKQQSIAFRIENDLFTT